MNAKQLGIIIGICAVLGVVGLLTARKDVAAMQATSAKAGEKLLPNLPINDIATIVIDGGDKKLTVSKRDGRWCVPDAADYEADYQKIGDMLKKLMDLKTAQIIPVGDKDLGRLELNKPGSGEGAGTLLDLQNEAGKSVASLLLGKEHMRQSAADSPMGGAYPDGRYVMLPGSSSAVVVSETFSDVVTDADRWLDKTFLKVDKIRSGEARQGDKVVWRVARADEAATLSLDGEVPEGQEVDSSKLTGIDSTLRYPSFAKVGGKEAGTDWGFAGEDGRVFVADTFDGRTWTVKVGKKQEDGNFPVAVSVAFMPPALADGPKDETEDAKKARQEAHDKTIADVRKEVEQDTARYQGWVYLVASYGVDDLLYKREDLLKKKEEPKAPEGSGALPPGHPPTDNTPIPFLPPGN